MTARAEGLGELAGPGAELENCRGDVSDEPGDGGVGIARTVAGVVGRDAAEAAAAGSPLVVVHQVEATRPTAARRAHPSMPDRGRPGLLVGHTVPRCLDLPKRSTDGPTSRACRRLSRRRATASMSSSAIAACVA